MALADILCRTVDTGIKYLRQSQFRSDTMGFRDVMRSKLSRETAPTDFGPDQDTSLGFSNITSNHDPNSNISTNHVPAQQAAKPQQKPFQNTSTTHSTLSEADKQRFEDYYSEQEKQKLRSKGINPALKAEMEINRKEGGGGSFANKLLGSGVGIAPGSIT